MFMANSELRAMKATQLLPDGLISNPTIFDYAIRNSAAHDAAILEKPAKGNLRPWNSRKKFGLAPEHVTTIGKELLGRK
jgi:hypothetical protein